MKTIELKNWAAYLPYGVEFDQNWAAYLPYDVEFEQNLSRYTLTPVNLCSLSPFARLHLRPLSDLTREIEHNGERFVPMFKLEEIFKSRFNIDDQNPAKIVQFHLINLKMHGPDHVVKWFADILLSWHFDIYNLIDSGLAVRKEDANESN